MYRSSSGRSSPSKESCSSASRLSRSGASTSGSTRSRSPRRSRSPSPRGRRRGRRSPSSSRSSRRSPSPHGRSRVRSPPGASRSRRESKQRDSSRSRRLNLGRHAQLAGRRSPSRHSESSEEQSLQTTVYNDRYGIDSLEQRRQSDRAGLSVDSLSDMGREDSRELGNYRSEKNMCQDTPSRGYVIPGLTNSKPSSEPQVLHTPEKAPAMPKKSILKKRVDDPSVQVENYLIGSNKNADAESVNNESQAYADDSTAFLGIQPNAFSSEQNFGSFLRKKDYQETASESAGLSDDFLLPHERAIQDGSEISHTLDTKADSTSAQEKRRKNFLDVEDEEKFLYGGEENDSNINCPTKKLTMNGGKESVSLNKRPPSPIQSVKPDTLEGSGIEFKIYDLLKTIGLDIEMAEIGEGAARTQERLHGKKTLHSLDGLSHKADSSEKDSIQSSTYSSGSDQNSLSPCGSSRPSNDVSSTSISKHAKSKTLEYDNSADAPEQSFPSVSVTPSAPPFLPNLPPPSPISQYSLSHFSASLAAQVLQNYPPPAVTPPNYNAYRHCMAYSSSACPVYTPPQQSNPSLPDVHGLTSVVMPPKPTRSNLRVIETVSIVEENPEIKINKSVLVQVPITPTESRLLSQSSTSDTTKRIPDGNNQTSEKPQVIEEEEEEKLMSEEAQQKKLEFLRNEFHRRCKQEGRMLQNKNNARRKEDDPLLAEMKRIKVNIVKEVIQLTSEMKQSHLDNVSDNLGINTLGKSWKQASENIVKECLNKNPLCEARRTLDHQAGLTQVQETACSLKRKQCEKQKEDQDGRSAKVARREEPEITKEWRKEGDGNEITNGKDEFHGQKVMIRLVLKKDNIQVKKMDDEIEESQKESSQSSSEKHSLRKTETNNQSQDQNIAAPKAESTEKDKRRENKPQSGNPDSKQKVTVTKAQNPAMGTKEWGTAKVAKMQQHLKSFDSPHSHLLSPLPPGPPLSLVAASALGKPAPAKASGIQSSDGSTELLPVGKKGNPELVLSPNTAKASSCGAVISKSSQENVKLQGQVEVLSEEPGSVLDTVECARVQKEEVTKAKEQKVGAVEKQAVLKMVKMKQGLQTSQKPNPPPLTPRPPFLLPLPLRPLLPLVPTLPHFPQLQFPFAVSGPANVGHSLCTNMVPCLNRDKRITVSAGQKKSVWIVGHSIVFRAGAYAASTGWDSNLGLGDRLHITWLGRQGLRWPALLAFISNQVFQQGPPDAIIIQLGEDDLLIQNSALLLQTITWTLHTLHNTLPQTSLFFSTLLKQHEWCRALCPEKLGPARRKICKSVSKVVESFGELTIPHPDILYSLEFLFQADGVSLSEWGMDIWLHDIRYALLKWLQT